MNHGLSIGIKDAGENQSSNGRQQVFDTGHTGEIFSIAIAPGGTQLVAASRDNTVSIWNIPDPSERRAPTRACDPIHAHRSHVLMVVWCPEYHKERGWSFATAGGDGHIKVWDASNKGRIYAYTKDTDTHNSSVDLIRY